MTREPIQTAPSATETREDGPSGVPVTQQPDESAEGAVQEPGAVSITISVYDLEAVLADADAYGGSTWGNDYRGRLRATLDIARASLGLPKVDPGRGGEIAPILAEAAQLNWKLMVQLDKTTEQQARADKAEAAIQRVRKLANGAAINPPRDEADAALQTFGRLILAALAEGSRDA